MQKFTVSESGQHSVSHELGDGQWHTLLENGAFYMRTGAAVTVQLYNVTAYSDKDRSLGTLPAGYRPSDSISSNAGADRAAMGLVASGYDISYVRVSPGGEVVLPKGVSGPMTGQVSFPAL